MKIPTMIEYSVDGQSEHISIVSPLSQHITCCAAMNMSVTSVKRQILHLHCCVLSQIMDAVIQKLMRRSLVRPKLEYGAWNLFIKQNINEIERMVQPQAATFGF